MLKIGWVKYFEVLNRFFGKLFSSTFTELSYSFLTPNTFRRILTCFIFFTSSKATDKVFLFTFLKFIFSAKALLKIVSVFSFVSIVTVSKKFLEKINYLPK